ncbi:GDP-Man:Man(3)GlcNAc(2)-PP-Dol alpha-1,2-mannosyltransferase [Lingula anatina]|uniref:GDP-Man:Man(3)GlcNAc(2)-PP-Dol alpha-1,2-mannosyltransferase n=1 Tax=Lingula anatina TaxID=7574 RepID=A0A1S3JES0_LINAN|nr:GDP-Man:Man(3)GlcNAc(2)-PP-Dol alpha-1,2-mannosyltransferase [Lingula anatina]XP_013408389.1 GDP-Man:Man(3)GlcNAc(2)-PP-Dol alpha-1,2-mannosyltransferase [Lingula anatina]|eukprot:XP_013408388.1 GDP-Man:Man(3)GlcNAc(2)-PP-Dol alpha-1,2-mannosyltransferase [Lingula anatina]
MLASIITAALQGAAAILLLVVGVLLTLRLYIRHKKKNQLPHLRQDPGSVVVGFFHPYCNAGGGGERVLWCAIKALQKKYPAVQCVVYTGDQDATGEEILQKAWQRFNIKVSRPVEFVYLTRRDWVEAKTWPYFTLLGQSMGSVFLGWEALCKLVPDVYIDTMGYAFTIPLFKYIGGCQTGCYVHYPTISNDMLERVAQRTESYNNRRVISKNPVLSFFKLVYYHMFAFAYGVAGKRSDVIMVNSSWTLGHILHLWRAASKTSIVYPPCDVEEFLKLPLKEEDSQRTTHTIVSIAQFRPEKDHDLQLRSFHEFLKKKSNQEISQYKLILIGSCRNAGDVARVEELRVTVKDLGLEDSVEFLLNVSFEELKKQLHHATIGLHTMWNEHFGIGVVEIMAAGTIVLAHNSGGPKMDIVVDRKGTKTGFLASDITSYADAMETIFNLTPQERMEIRMNARESVKKFSEEEFSQGFLSCVSCILEEK